ncbi:MAG: T9SS type A sorting domain-containing protein [Candidatus Glassbacteria bacterium]|nr:T9SS type A sorting domain-containing protein [Candidatus Glassbacteria bacterium]
MKIIKILFLGIVLVLFNIAYLAAQQLPDSITVNFSSVEPGEVLTVTVDARFHSESSGGFILVASGLPAGMVTTDVGVDLAEGTMPTDPGTWAYEWTEGYGKILADVATSPLVQISLDETTGVGTMGVIILNANIDLYLRTLPPEFGGIDPAAVGPFAKLYINVPADFPEGTYELTLEEDGLSIQPFPVDGPAFEGLPYFSTNSIIVAEIPDNNYLQMVATQGAASGGGVSVAVQVANKDSVGSGSFVVTYPSSVLTLRSVTAGARAVGATFAAPVIADISTALAAVAVSDKQATINFSGASIGPGGLGGLCTLLFDVASVGAGVTASVALSTVDLKDMAGTSVGSQIAPPVGATELSFSFGDTLSLADMVGEGTAIIIDGQLHVPVVLKNASAVSAVEFYITEPAGQEDILSLSSDIVLHVDRADGWVVTANDSGSYVHVIAYSPVAGGSIAAGNGQLFHVVFDIDSSAFTVPAPGGPTVDLALGLGGVQLTAADGSMLGVESIGATASLDFRVPNDGEGVGPGASLPKDFSLLQNHPNPFNPSTTINYQIPDDAGSVQFRLNVYDIRGRLIRTLDKGMKGAGTYSVFWDGTDNYGRQVSSGVYFYRFISSEYNVTRKMIMLK